MDRVLAHVIKQIKFAIIWLKSYISHLLFPKVNIFYQSTILNDFAVESIYMNDVVTTGEKKLV